MAFPIGLALSIGSSLLGSRNKEQPPGFQPPEFQHHQGGWGMNNPIAMAYNAAAGVTPIRAAADEILRRNGATKGMEAPSGGAPAPAAAGGQTSLWNQVKSTAVTSLISSLFSPRSEPQAPQFTPPTFGGSVWR